jgi:nucleoid-associated protein YgaU
MLTRRQPSRTRCVLVAVATTAGATGAARALARGVVGPVPSVEEALVRLCLGALLGAVAWAWLATLSVVAEAWRGRAGRRRVAAPLRRLVLVCCGVVLAAPVGAAAGDQQPAPRAALAGLPMPDRATGPAQRPLRSTHPAPRTVVVRAGDCLWHLAAADLPAGASAALVTARWHAIHRRNAAVIGPDPDLIHPGQRLALPHAPQPGDPRR